jgi:hypothetical protein
MGLSVAQGVFTKRSGTGAQNVPYSPSFTGKVAYFWGTHRTAVGGSVDASEFFGATSGTAAAQNRCIATYQTDNLATSDSEVRMATDAISILSDSVTPTIAGAAVLTAFNNGSLDLNWTVSDTNAIIIYFLVLGGTDITNVLVGDRTWATATGNQPFTGVGFQPNFLHFFGGSDRTAALPGNEGDYIRDFGAVLSTSNRWALAASADTADTMSPFAAGRRLVVTECASKLDNFGAALSKAADFVTFDTDGWTWNVTNATSAAAFRFYFVAFKFSDVANNVAIGTFDKCTTLNCTSDVNTGQGTVKGVLLFGRTAVAGTTILDDARLAVGGSDFTNEGAVAIEHAETTGGNTIVKQRISSSKAFHTINPGTSDAWDEADASAIASGFRTTWTLNNSAVAHTIAYISFGEAAAGVVTPPRPIIIKQAVERSASW